MSLNDRPLFGDGNGSYRIAIVGNSGAGKVLGMYGALAPYSNRVVDILEYTEHSSA